MQTAVVSVWK